MCTCRPPVVPPVVPLTLACMAAVSFRPVRVITIVAVAAAVDLSLGCCAQVEQMAENRREYANFDAFFKDVSL